MTPTSPALRYHGSKWRLAPWVMQFFPKHTCYVEPFGGAAGVMLQKPRSYSEVYNDLDREIVNFFRVVRDPASREKLSEALAITPYAREEWELAYESTDCPIESARRVLIRAHMGFGSAGATKGVGGFRIDTKRGYATAMHLWPTFSEKIMDVGERFLGVLIENRPAVDVMRQHDAHDTLHYVDPPYLPETRVPGRYYRHEMTVDQHIELLDAIKDLKGYVVLSGYPNAIYDNALPTWEKHSTEARISANRGTKVRTECVWLNPACQSALKLGRQADIFEGVASCG